MSSNTLAPLLAILIAFAGFVHGDAPATRAASRQPALLAVKHAALWHCTGVPVVRSRELVRRPCGVGQGNFALGCPLASSRLPIVAAISSCCATRASARLQTLHELRVKLQV